VLRVVGELQRIPAFPGKILRTRPFFVCLVPRKLRNFHCSGVPAPEKPRALHCLSFLLDSLALKSLPRGVIGSTTDSGSVSWGSNPYGVISKRSRCDISGEVTERPNVPVSKTGVPATVPRVRIPPSPLSYVAPGCGVLFSLEILQFPLSRCSLLQPVSRACCTGFAAPDLHRLFRPAFATGSLLKVGNGCQRILWHCNRWRIPRLCRDHVDWDIPGQFDLPAGSQGVKQFWPRYRTGSPHDLLAGCAELEIPPTVRCVTGHAIWPAFES
jgi:hypothetical protein